MNKWCYALTSIIIALLSIRSKWEFERMAEVDTCVVRSSLSYWHSFKDRLGRGQLLIHPILFFCYLVPPFGSLVYAVINKVLGYQRCLKICTTMIGIVSGFGLAALALETICLIGTPQLYLSLLIGEAVTIIMWSEVFSFRKRCPFAFPLYLVKPSAAASKAGTETVAAAEAGAETTAGRTGDAATIAGEIGTETARGEALISSDGINYCR